MSASEVDAGAIGRRARRDKGQEPIRRAALQDARLSFRARGVLSNILSRPPDWRFSVDRLARESPREARDAISSALGELEEVGYVLRERVRLADGTCTWLWFYDDDPAEVLAAVPTVLAELGAEVIPRTPRAKDRVPAAVKAPRSRKGAFAQVRPNTAQPSSGDPSSGEPSSDEPNTAEPVSYREREQIPLTPNGRTSGPVEDTNTDAPPAPRSAGGVDRPEGCAKHGRRVCRTCGLSPRGLAAAEGVEAVRVAHDEVVRSTVERRTETAERRAGAPAAAAKGMAQVRAVLGRASG